LNGCIHAVSGIDPAAQECIKTAERQGFFYRRERKERKEGGQTPLNGCIHAVSGIDPAALFLGNQLPKQAKYGEEA